MREMDRQTDKKIDEHKTHKIGLFSLNDKEFFNLYTDGQIEG